MENKFQVKGKVKVIKNGTIIAPESGGLRFVLSLANMAGKVTKEENPLLPLFSKKWKQVEVEGKGWFANKTGAYKLGAIHTTAVQSDVWVIHMLCQDEKLKINESNLVECLKKVAASAKYEKATVHISSILTTMLPDLSKLIEENLVNHGVSVCYYEESAA